LLFDAEASEHLSSSKAQNLSQRKLASEGNVDPSNAAAVLHVLNKGPQQRILQCVTATSLSIRLSTHCSLLFAAEASEHLSISKAQNLSQRKLSSEGNVDPSNAAALLHVLNKGQIKDITMCCCGVIIHQTQHALLFALC
jgi:hypothetical protein